MSLQTTLTKLRAVAVEHKVSLDTAIDVGLKFCEITADKSSAETRNEAKAKLRDFYADNGDIEIDRDILCRDVGLKNTNADRQWLSHQLKVLKLEHQPTKAAAD